MNLKNSKNVVKKSLFILMIAVCAYAIPVYADSEDTYSGDPTIAHFLSKGASRKR